MTWEEIIERYRLPVRWQGSQWRGPCPLHDGNNDSAFAITPGKGFTCFACDEAGGMERFLRLMGDHEAADALESEPRRRVFTPMPVVSTPARPLAPLDPTHPYFRERGIHEATAQAFGIGYFRGGPPFGKRIVVPLHDSDGALVGHIGRAVDDDVEPRYLFQRGVRRSELLFNLHRVKASGADSVIVVEGIFDALAVYQVGHANVVATLGCTVTENQRALLSRFRRIQILFDEDDAGARAAAKLADDFGAVAVRLHLPKADPATIKGVLLDRILRG